MLKNFMNIKKWKPIVKQLFKEYWLPFAGSIIWTIYAFRTSSLNIQEIIGRFGASFFLMSWLLSQVLRVIKQQKIDRDLGGIQQQVEAVLTDFKIRTENVISHITGGDGYCYFLPTVPENNVIRNFWVSCEGSFPIYGVTARMVDLDKFKAFIERNNHRLSEEGIWATQTVIPVGDLIPGHATQVAGELTIESSEKADFNIFFFARNGAFTQHLRYRKVNGEWRSALKVKREQKTLFEQIQPGYPVNAEGVLDWDS